MRHLFSSLTLFLLSFLCFSFSLNLSTGISEPIAIYQPVHQPTDPLRYPFRILTYCICMYDICVYLFPFSILSPCPVSHCPFASINWCYNRLSGNYKSMQGSQWETIIVIKKRKSGNASIWLTLLFLFHGLVWVFILKSAFRHRYIKLLPGSYVTDHLFISGSRQGRFSILIP